MSVVETMKRNGIIPADPNKVSCTKNGIEVNDIE
jgi:hypothetical protein